LPLIIQKWTIGIIVIRQAMRRSSTSIHPQLGFISLLSKRILFTKI